jgi:CDP-diacylglycerol--serine O-phosphatidyltransferase
LGKSNRFELLPIPSSLVLVGMLSHWQWVGWTADTQGIPLGQVTLLGKSDGDGGVDVVGFVFAAWAAAMVSKTLRVPKP